MLPKSKLKNQVVISPPKTRRMAAKEKSNLDKENMAAVQDVVNVTKRRREAIKPLQDKKDPPVTVNVTKRRRDAIKPLEEKNDTVEDVKQAKKNERSKSVVETISTISHVTTRRMREKRRRSKSDNSENRILRKTNVQTQLKKIAGTKPKTTTNITPLQNKQFVQTRKMTALEATPQILTPSNVTMRKKVVAATELENKAQTKSTDKEAFEEHRKPSTRKEKVSGNSSIEPIYKQKLDDNMNATVDSVFDFESNSQEITAKSDEPMKDIIEKLVRENKAVVKHKATRKKGVTATKGKVAKGRVTKEKVANGRVTKKIVTRSEAKVSNVKVPISNLREMPKSSLESILKTTAIAPHANIGQFVEPQGSTNAINESTDVETSIIQEDYIDTENVPGIKDSENVPGIKDSENVPGIKDSENVPEIKDSEDVPKIVESEDVVEIADTQDVATSLWAKPLTPLRVHKKYDRSLLKSITPHHQSTPVRQAETAAFSPWRVSRRELPSSSSMDLELSRIVPIDDTKDNIKGNKGKTIEERVAALQQSDKPKAVSDDIKNCFGFNVDDSDDDDDATVKDAMPNPVPKIRESLPNINLSIIETLNDRRRANKQPISKCETKISKESTARRLKQPKTVTGEQFGNFGSAEVKPRIEKQNEVQNNKAKVQPKSNYFRKLSVLGQPDKNSQKASSSNSKASDEVPVLFETNWPTREEKKHRSYARVPQQKYKSIINDDESEAVDMTEQRRNKRTKQKEDPKFEEELRKFEEEFNSSCNEIEKYDLIKEVSKSENTQEECSVA